MENKYEEIIETAETLNFLTDKARCAQASYLQDNIDVEERDKIVQNAANSYWTAIMKREKILEDFSNIMEAEDLNQIETFYRKTIIFQDGSIAWKMLLKGLKAY